MRHHRVLLSQFSPFDGLRQREVSISIRRPPRRGNRVLPPILEMYLGASYGLPWSCGTVTWADATAVLPKASVAR